MENIKTILTTLGGSIVSVANFKLMSISVTEHMEVANGIIGFLVGILTLTYLALKISKENNDKTSSK